MLVPAANLHTAPWGLLPVFEESVLSVSPSTSLWLKVRSAPRPSLSRVVLVAGPRLAHAESEVGSLRARHPGATVLTGPDASVGGTLAALDGAGLAHVAAHGAYRSDAPLFSSLALAGTACGTAPQADAQPDQSADRAQEPALPPSIAALRPMTEGVTPISVDERRGRIEKARRLMRDNGMQALMLASGTSLRYFTGLSWWPSERLLTVVIPASGAPFLVTPKFEESCWYITSWPTLPGTRLYRPDIEPPPPPGSRGSAGIGMLNGV